MADLPSPLTYGTVTFGVSTVDPDGADSGTSPDLLGATGRIRLRPLVPYVKVPSLTGGPQTIIAREASLAIVNGVLQGLDGGNGVNVLASDNASTVPTPMPWVATYYLDALPAGTIPDTIFMVPSGGTVDLTTAINTTALPGVTVIPGDIGSVVAAITLLLPGLVATALASDPTLIASVTAALTAAISARPVVPGQSFTDTAPNPYVIPFLDALGWIAGGVHADGSADFANFRHAPASIPFTALDGTVPITNLPSEFGWAIPFYDGAGYVVGGILPDGSALFLKQTYPAASIPGSALQPGAGLTPLPGEFGYSIPFYDAAGYICGGFLADGSFTAVNGFGLTTANILTAAQTISTFTKSRKKQETIIGDSLSRGFTGGVDWAYSESWPGQMALTLPTDVVQYNLAHSGWTVDEQAAQMGAMPFVVTVTGGSIPATTTAVAVTIPAGFGWGYSASRDFPYSIAGVEGNLNHAIGAAATDMTFTRTTAGSVVAVAPGTVGVSDYAGHYGDTLLVMLGRNDSANNVSGLDGGVAAHIIASLKKIEAWANVQVKQVLYLGMVKATGETGAAGAIPNTVNASIPTWAPGRFLDLNSYVVNQAIYDMGIVPTTADLAAIAGGVPPGSIMYDSVHWIKATAAVIGPFVAKWLLARGWA